MPAVSWAVENKVITGKTSGDKIYIDPLGTATRAETASIIHKYIKNSRVEKLDNGFKVKGKLNISKTNNSSETNENSTDRTEENAPSNTSSTHTVVKGDTLWGIAKKYYGDGSKYPQIKEKNKAKYSSLSKNNIIYVGWVLEL
jgi:nucleoid-associated protein YgaU